MMGWRLINISLLFVLLLAQGEVFSQTITRGPYLQKATPTSIVIRWYTSTEVDSRVTFGEDPGDLSQSRTVTGTRTNHTVELTGLTPYTKYYYSVGTTTTIIQSGLQNYFLTSPLPNAEDKYTFWVTGDAGDGSTRQRDVRDRYYNYIGDNITNGWLLLGDNAYDNGTETVYTNNFFQIYQDNIMRKTSLWPATGNHDYANSLSRQRDQNIPYFDFFDLPASGEAGGIPSGSEAYYSFDYGNIHFVALDSYIIEGYPANNYRLYDIAGPQVQWLRADLAANTKKWTIVYFHHPPYSMGSHNSDTEFQMVKIRENIAPILEQYDVDLVLSGHSHSYERSKPMKGHFGEEATFDPQVHHLSQSSGRYDGTANSCTYIKDSPASIGGTIYAVAGSAGKTDYGQAGRFPHDAMYFGEDVRGGSLILEIQGNRLDGKFLPHNSDVILDKFTIMKNVNKVTNINLTLGESVDLEASWVGQYSWSSGQSSRNISITPSATTTYTVTDQYTCITDTYNINVGGPSTTIDISSLGFSEICAGADVNISFTATGTFTAGNIFTLQLSNSSGSFASPISIGTLSGNTSGTINGLIPGNTAGGNNYRLRVVSSNPSFTGSSSGTFIVRALPVVSAPSQVCIGSTITLSPTSGGTWLSSDNTKATVTNSGVVTGIAEGSVTFTFTATVTGCSNTTSPVTVNSLPSASISYSGSPFCAEGTASVTRTGQAGGTYSSTSGLSISSTTGALNLAASTAGTYLVTYTFSSGGCSNATTSSVTINALPASSISYSGSPYCAEGTENVTRTGQAGGTYSSTGGLSINSTTGALNLAASTAGTYPVTYTFSNGTCSNTTTTSVTINALPTASISYSGSPYCATGTVSVTRTGQAGGTYSSTSGLSINSTTGALNLAASTAGTYQVTYSFSNGGCSNTTTTDVTINALPAASISYTGSPYCAEGTAGVSRTGQAGGTYSSTAGLSINSTTGALNLAASTAGTYPVTYTFSNGTCSNTTTASVTINALPSASISYSGSPYCAEAQRV